MNIIDVIDILNTIVRQIHFQNEGERNALIEKISALANNSAETEHINVWGFGNPPSA